MGVRVIVGVSVGLGVGEGVTVKVGVEVGEGVGVQAEAVIVAICSADGPQALRKRATMIRIMMVNFLVFIAISFPPLSHV